MDLLETGVKQVKNVSNFVVGAGSMAHLDKWLEEKRSPNGRCILFVDHALQDTNVLSAAIASDDYYSLHYVDTENEPTTEGINNLVHVMLAESGGVFDSVVGLGGGITMDTAKAVSNLLSNGGKAEDYQGWDLLGCPGVFKIGIPTISGTGAEATRTCVMTNKATGLKLGMNSDYTVFDRVILDPDLTASVPRDQYFWTGMDAYIHCVEALEGAFRNAIGDAYSRQTIALCEEIFSSEDMQSPDNREKMMVASYLGGCSIATSYVGVVHPLSAALSVVLGLHHCVANCITMRAVEEFYPEAFSKFWHFAECQQVNIPQGVTSGLSESEFKQLYDACIVHERPLTNALGSSFREILTPKKVRTLFEKM